MAEQAAAALDMLVDLIAERVALKLRAEAPERAPLALLSLGDLAPLFGCSVPTMRATLERVGYRGYQVGDHFRFDLHEAREAVRKGST